MEDNPYTALVNTLREDAIRRSSVIMRYGTVRSEMPLCVNTGGVTLGVGILTAAEGIVSSLRKGDTVLLFCEDDNFTILCKVVRV